MMGGFAGIWQWVIVLVIVLILFGGRGKISRVMGDIGKGIKSFKSGVKEGGGDDDESEEAKEKPALKSEAVAEPAEEPEPKKAAKG